jgi:hypothetical protein
MQSTTLEKERPETAFQLAARAIGMCWGCRYFVFAQQDVVTAVEFPGAPLGRIAHRECAEFYPVRS